MSAAFQAIIDGVRADARHTGWCAQLTRRPRARRQALALRQDAFDV